nr:alpha/beta hydrolase [Photobacterium phosphoreum]
MIEASKLNKAWKAAIINAIDYEYKSYQTNNEYENLLCLTVHGIRTKGRWQNVLEEKIQQHIGDVKVSPYNYGYLDLLSFFLPFARIFTVFLFRKKLEDCLKNNKDKDIYIFSHSFGTYLVVKSLNQILKKDSYLNINKIVLSGSVLKSEFDFSRIMKKTNAIIINDCGESDYILSASQAFVPNMGMAGKVGFYCFNDDRVINRHFDGGHSHYFDNKTRFIEKFWIPLFYKKNDIKHIDLTTKDSYWNSLLDSVTSYLGKVKEIIYILLIVYFLFL